MDITRINSERQLISDVSVLFIEIKGKTFRLTESVDGRLNVLCEDSLVIHPCVSNVVEIQAGI